MVVEREREVLGWEGRGDLKCGGGGEAFDEPTAHLMTSGSNIEKHPNTRLRAWSRILPSAERRRVRKRKGGGRGGRCA